MLSNNVKVWSVGVGAIVMSLVTVITVASTLSLYVVPICEGLGVSRADVSLMFSISSFAGVFGAFAVGPMMNKIHPKIVVCLGGICVFIYFAAVSLANDMMPIYIAVVFKGFANMFSGMAMAQIIIAQWFQKARGKVMSVVSVVTVLFASASVMLLNYCIEAFGYRTAAMGEAIIAGVIICLIGIIFVDRAPEECGYLPYGVTKEEASAQAQAKDPSASEKAVAPASLSIKEIFGFPELWAILLIAFLASLYSAFFNSNGAPLFMSIGLDSTAAATCVSAFNLSGVVWNFLFGAISDKSIKTAIAINGILAIIGCFVIGFCFGAPLPVALVLAALYQAGGTISNLAGSLFATKVFGAKQAPTLIGAVRGFSALGAIIGPIIAGYCYDATGSYVMALGVDGIALVLVVVLAFAVGGKKASERVQAKIDKKLAEKGA